MDVSALGNNGVAVKTGVFSAKGTVEQQAHRRSKFWSRKEDIKNFPVDQVSKMTDFGKRAYWNSDGPTGTQWNPFTQISCSLGAGVIQTPAGIKLLVEKAKEYGTIFLFTCRPDHPKLMDEARSNPNVKELIDFPSWMGDYQVHLFAAIP